jgi:nitrite reductase (NO-forming)
LRRRRAAIADSAAAPRRRPGIYAYVTHNLIEAAELGATAHFKVEGKWNDDLMTQVKAPAEIPAPKTN